MNSISHFRSPSEYVLFVINELEKRLNTPFPSAYKRQPVEATNTQFSYHIGDSKVRNETGNDGRKQHVIELRFLIEVPLAKDNFDLEALDASTRLERELLNEWFNLGALVEDTRVVSNTPRKFDPKNGVFLRTVSMTQRIYLGDVGSDY